MSENHLPTDLTKWLHDMAASADELFELQDWKSWGERALSEIRRFSNLELTLDCESENLLLALKMLVDRDFAHLNGFVMGGQIQTSLVKDARDLIRKIEAPQ